MNILSSNNIALLFVAFYMLLFTGEVAAFTSTIMSKNRHLLLAILIIALFALCIIAIIVFFDAWWNYQTINLAPHKPHNIINKVYHSYDNDYDDWLNQIIKTSSKYYTEGMI